LFFSSGTTFEEYAEGGHYRMTKADKRYDVPRFFCAGLLIYIARYRENIIMIASEPLTFEQKDWMEVKTNTMVVITPKVCARLTAVWISRLSRALDESPTSTDSRES
jgi:predicted glutamine amidotransferase